MRSQSGTAHPATTGARESGIGYMAQSAFWFAVMSTLVKLASAQMPTMQIVFLRGCITLVLAGLVLWRAGLKPLGTRPRLLVVRGLIGSGALVCFYAAVVHMPLAEATVIHQTAPLFTALLAALVLHERLQLRVLLSIGTCLIGVLMIARPATLFGGAVSGFDWVYALVALLGALLSALAYVTVRRLGQTENPLVVVFYFPLMTVPLTAPFALPIWVWPDATGWLLLLGIGIATQLAQVAMTKGLAREAAGRATAIGYLQVGFATLFGAIVFGVWPDAWSWGGMLVILLSLFASTAAQQS
ncbi:MAG TPA: DMT family transporter [Planctomycetota bacterium]|nr:DMT family transporter [Planctomycetota bacterium]